MALCSSSAPPESELVILVVNPHKDDLLSLRGILPSNWILYIAGDAVEAKQILGHTSVPVILCESELPDGNWKDLLVAVAGIQSPPLLIVTSRLADEFLWAEVLNLGGYDVLAKPFNSNEFIQVVSTAWRRWKDEWKSGSGESAMAQSA
jgi:DNA-binding response OmpR family regulator